MKLQFISDLHLELSDNSRWITENLPEVVGDVLLIAGDSGYLNKNSQYQMHPFWQWASEHYQQAVLNSNAPNKVVLIHHVPTFLCQPKS